MNNTTYSPAKIADELDDTALGRTYYGNALRVAKDFPLTDEDRSCLDRWTTGQNNSTDHISLQDIAIKIRAFTGE